MIDIAKANQAEQRERHELEQHILVMEAWVRLVGSEHWSVIQKHLTGRVEAMREALCRPLSADETTRLRNQIECYRDLLRQPELAQDAIQDAKKRLDRLRSNQVKRHTYGLEGILPSNATTTE